MEPIQRGSTGVRVQVFIQNSSVTTGAGLTGLAYNTSGLTAYYLRDGDSASTAITLAAGTLGTWSSGGFVAVDGTNMPGMYELGLPNAAVASGNRVTVYLQGAANMAPCPAQIPLVAYNPQDSAALGLSAVPIAFGTALPAAPAANSVGEALVLADILGGRANTAQGGTSTTITLDASASSDANAYIGDDIYLIGGTGGGVRGTGQRRTVVAYNTSTKVATVQRAWDTTPDNTTKFITLPQPQANVGLIGNYQVTATAAFSFDAQTTSQTNVANIASGTTVVRGNDYQGNHLALASIFPANFSSLGISGGGAINNVLDLGGTAVTSFSGTVGSGSATLTVAAVATAVWQDATAGDFTAASSIGKYLYGSSGSPGAAGGLPIVSPDGTARLGEFVFSSTRHLLQIDVEDWGNTGSTLTANANYPNINVVAWGDSTEGIFTGVNGGPLVEICDKTGVEYGPTHLIPANAVQLGATAVTSFSGTVGSGSSTLTLGAITATQPANFGSLVLSNGQTVGTSNYAGGNITGNVSGSVGSVTDAVVLPVGTGAGQINLSGGAVTLQSNQAATAEEVATAVLASTIDGGVTLQQALTALLSYTNGKCSVTPNGDGTATFVGYMRDNATIAFTVTFNLETFARAAAGTIG